MRLILESLRYTSYLGFILEKAPPAGFYELPQYDQKRSSRETQSHKHILLEVLLNSLGDIHVRE